MSQKIALLFPGQGSQSVGMLDEYAQLFPIVKETFKEASDTLGTDLWEIVNKDPNEQLNLTEWTQPSLLASGVAIWRVWQQQLDVNPNFFAGHSLGEYTALVCAEALTLAEAIPLVATRGKLMQQACEEGTGSMAAILGLDFNSVQELCEAVSSPECYVSAANDNAPGQTVIAGHRMAVEAVMKLAKEKGAKRSVLLPVSVPSHCPLMKPAAEQLSQHLNQVDWKTPKIPVIHNFNVSSHTQSTEIIDALQAQLYNPVRWVDTINFLLENQVEYFVESGPGSVLTGLNKRSAKGKNCLSLNDVKQLDELKSQVVESIL